MATARTTISCSCTALIISLAVAAAAGRSTQESTQSPQYAPRWIEAIPAAPMFPPAIAGDRVYLAYLPGVVAAFAVSDGKEVWHASIIPGQPVVVDEQLVFIVAGDAIHALRTADGSVAWRAAVGVVTAPLLAKSGWLVVTSSQSVRGLRAADGAVVWSRDATLYQKESGAINGNTLFLPGADGRIHALDLLSGKHLWEHRIGGSPSHPLPVGDRLYFGATDKQFYCLDARSGEEKWRHRVGASVRGRPDTDGERIFVAGLDNLVRAYDIGNGALKWLQGVPFRPLTGPAVIGSSVFVAGPVADIRVLRASDGKPAGAVTFPEKLGAPPNIVTTPSGLQIAGVTGSLQDGWKLSLVATAPPSPKVGAISVPPLRSTPVPHARSAPGD